jgi:hypothetical protein
MIWKMKCYDMYIIYFNRGNNWFVPKCLVILAKIKYMYIVIEEEESASSLREFPETDMADSAVL